MGYKLYERRKAAREAAAQAMRRFHNTQQLANSRTVSDEMWLILGDLERALDAVLAYVQAVEDSAESSDNE